jgi:enoyl-[acyl-carrier protein] reductase I
MPSLSGKKGLIVGVANKRSISWAIAQAAAQAGAHLALTYQGERLEENVRELCSALSEPLILPMDVTDDLVNPFVQTSRDGFKLAMDVSAYSLVALARRALPLMEKNGGGSILTLTYLGSARVFETYRVMGVAKAALEATVRYLAADLGPKNIRVNAISAGPIKTLASAGIPGFSNILQIYRDRAPLRRTVDTSDVADAAIFLLSDASRAVTAEILMVDAGFHATGM